MGRGRLIIPAPKARIDEDVIVLNYRCRPARWEVGIVADVRYVPAATRTGHDGSTYQTPERWSYDVVISRPVSTDAYGRRRGGGYRIVVGDDGIRRTG